MTFRYPCFRDFKTFSGKTSALYELIELAVREFEANAKASGNDERYIAEIATRHRLHVHFVQCPDIVEQTIRLHIANAHESFERFLEQFHKEYTGMTRVEWRYFEKKSELYTVLQNVFGTQAAAGRTLGQMQVGLCDYYRLIRNSTAHNESDNKSAEKYKQVEKYREQATKTYDKIMSAPNPPGQLSRDDFELCIRVARDVAWGLCQNTRPTDEQFLNSVEAAVQRFRARFRRVERIRQAVQAMLMKDYGLEADEAARISVQVH